MRICIIPQQGNYGYIVRTAAEGVGHDALRADMLFLNKLWEIIVQEMGSKRPGQVIHEDFSLAVRVIRDVVSSGIERIQVDS